MLAGEAPIVFPALLFDNELYFYWAVPTVEHLRYERKLQMEGMVRWEIVDSEGRRYLISAIVEPRKVRPKWSRWLERLILGSPVYHFDLKLTSLPSLSFDELLQLVTAKEAEQEAYHLVEGGGPDSDGYKAGLARCRSIAEIIADRELSAWGEPPASRPAN